MPCHTILNKQLQRMLISRFTKSTRWLPLTPIHLPFSVHNYMKTFPKQQVTRHHNHFRVDEYSHFDKDPAAVDNFIRQERTSMADWSSKWKQYTEQYYQISSSRRDARTGGVPERIDGYQYYTKIAWKGEREYSTVHRRKEGREELVLDLMAYPFISKYYQTAELLSTSFSPSHDLIAFAVDLKNNQKSAYFIAKTTNGHQLLSIGPSARHNMLQNAYDVTFATQDQIYFLRAEKHRPCKLFWMNIKTGQSRSLLEEQNEEFYMGLRKSKDRAFLMVSAVSKSSSKLWVVDVRKEHKLLKVWQAPGKVYINHVQNNFVVWLSKDCSEVKLIQDASVKDLLAKDRLDLSKIPGQVIYKSGQQEVVQDIDLFQDKVVLYGYNTTIPMLKVIHYEKANGKFTVNATNAVLPYSYGTILPCSNQDYRSTSLLFSVSTPFVYEEVYSCNLQTSRSQIVQEYEHTGPAIPTKRYRISVVSVPASDGQLIPLTIISPKTVTPSKLILHFYGCYGLATRVGYDNTTIAALQKGWTVCHAHVRGGNQKGNKWHQQSQGNNRLRSWLDVEQCVGYLLREKYTHPSLLFLSSSSAGAINLWNVISRKPYLYKGAIFRMPFLDVLSSLLDHTQPLSNTDYEQFGNPITHAASYRRIAAISPYENISPIEYPALHFIAGENDYRTPIAQLAKFVSRLRDRKVQNGRLGELGAKGVTVDISRDGSHLGEASLKDENYKGCDVYGYMDYVINNCSKDCAKQ